MMNHLQIVDLLLSLGADPNFASSGFIPTQPEYDYTNHFQKTLEARYGTNEAVEKLTLLFKHGMKITRQNIAKFFEKNSSNFRDTTLYPYLNKALSDFKNQEAVKNLSEEQKNAYNELIQHWKDFLQTNIPFFDTFSPQQKLNIAQTALNQGEQQAIRQANWYKTPPPWQTPGW